MTRSAEVQQRSVTGADGLRLEAYERNIGAPQTVLLVHGYPDDHVVWEPVADLLAERFHVITYDVRGAGGSATPSRVDDYRFDKLSGDVAAVLDACLADVVDDGSANSRRVHLVGHDWGSIQGWHFVCDASLHVDGVSRFASYTSISGPHLDAVGDFFHRRGPRPPSIPTVVYQGTKSWYVGVFQLPWLAPAFWRASFSRRSWPKVLADVEGVPAELLPDDAAITRTQANGANGVNLYRANMASPIMRPRPAHTNVPVQVIVPTHDRYVSPALATASASIGDDVSIVAVDGGHWLPLTEPALVAALVTGHISRHPAETST
ncbi:MAG TPA: alpha/beta fold hydrolase, partial [Microthrixaceae bacterium]|jgi:pimeloyl-ACP methyl ester carboxylesterase|nr:alpha/beta fold hydrolase [Microthrixaceae bacterium]